MLLKQKVFELMEGYKMRNVSLIRLVFLMAIFSFPTGNAIAEKINLTDAYVDKNFVGQCVMLFSYKTNGYVKLELKNKRRGTIFTESGLVLDADISFPNGNIRTKHQYGDVTSEMYVEDGKSYIKDLSVASHPKQPTHVGPCKTKYSDISSLPPLPSTSAPVSSAPVKIEKDEIAALEKKLAALKQKSARKEEYQKMRALLDQKLKELKGQIQMLEQEYKDVLN